MSAKKSERLMNLLILLLVSRSFLSKEEIRANIDGYRSTSEAAFEKMFERDKQELRDLGVPVELGTNDTLFADEPGYRIVRDSYELPPIDFSPEEVAMIGLAAQTWRDAGLSKATGEALVKLRAAGVGVDRSEVDFFTDVIEPDSATFDEFWSAIESQRLTAFEYRKRGHEVETRSVLPWKLLSARGRWYLVGYDLDREGARAFRLSRVVGAVRVREEFGATLLPSSEQIVEAAGHLLPPTQQADTAHLLLRTNRGAQLRRRAAVLAESVEHQGVVWDRVAVEFTEIEALAGEVLALGPDVIVEAPPTLKSHVLECLQSIQGAHA